jgi:hypothetical protein
MNIALWTVTVLLAVAFVASGVVKLALPRARLAAHGMEWTDDFSARTIHFIGVLEILAGLGLILPALFGIATFLVPLAAAGLVLLMAGGFVTHVRRHEAQGIAVTLAFLALAAFVAVGRLTFGGIA